MLKYSGCCMLILRFTLRVIDAIFVMVVAHS